MYMYVVDFSLATPHETPIIPHLEFFRGSSVTGIWLLNEKCNLVIFFEQVTLYLQLNCQRHQSQRVIQLEQKMAVLQNVNLVST